MNDNNEEVFVVNVDTTSEEVEVVNSVDTMIVKVEVTIVDCRVDIEIDSNGIVEVSIGNTVVKVEAIVKSVFKEFFLKLPSDVEFVVKVDDNSVVGNDVEIFVLSFVDDSVVSVLSAVDVIVVRVDWTIVDFSVDITVDNNEEVFVVNVDTTFKEVDIVFNSVDTMIIKVEVTIVDCWVDLEIDSDGIGNTEVKIEIIVKASF